MIVLFRSLFALLLSMLFCVVAFASNNDDAPTTITINGATYKKKEPEDPSRAYSFFFGIGPSVHTGTSVEFLGDSSIDKANITGGLGIIAFVGLDYLFTPEHHAYISYLYTRQFVTTDISILFSNGYLSNHAFILGYDHRFNTFFSSGFFGGLKFASSGGGLSVNSGTFKSNSVSGVFGIKGEYYLRKSLALGVWYAYYLPTYYDYKEGGSFKISGFSTFAFSIKAII